jgi:hypothetical protein
MFHITHNKKARHVFQNYTFQNAFISGGQGEVIPGLIGVPRAVIPSGCRVVLYVEYIQAGLCWLRPGEYTGLYRPAVCCIA